MQMRYIKALFMAMFMVMASVGEAATAYVTANVLRTLVADQDRWGGCMVFLDQPLAGAGLNCPSNWVSFSCNGTFTTKDVAYRMLDSAQMAYALGKQVLIQVDDTRKHNGYCYGSRVDVLP
jgi:hypothetical protein